MKNAVLGLIAVAGLAATASAQFSGTGGMRMEVSSDGGATWGAAVVVASGATVKYRLVGTYASSGPVAGVASVDLNQVLFAGADASDGLSIGTVVDNIPNTTTNSTASDGKRGFFDVVGGRKLDTTNTASTNPNSSSNRLKWGQLSNLLVSGLPINPDYKGGSPVEVFRGDFVAGAFGRVVTLSLDLAIGGVALGITAPNVGYNVHPGELTAGTSLVSTALTNTQYTGSGTATITIVPTPASLALLGLGGLVAGRRRR